MTQDQKWKLVPVEPTREMWAAVNKLDDEMAAGGYDGKGASIEQVWNCLVECAPTTPASAEPQAWISVADRLPAIDTWCNVLVDREEGDYFDRRGKPRFDVYGAQLRDVDSEGYASWQRWVMADGGPMGKLYMVTHWQPLPTPPGAHPAKQQEGDDDIPSFDRGNGNKARRRAIALGLIEEPTRPYGGDPAEPRDDSDRCEYCDGTGDVHGLYGEWRGECTVCKQEVDAAGEKDAAPKLYHFEQRSKFGPWIEVGLPTEKSVPFVQYAAMQAMKGDGNG